MSLIQTNINVTLKSVRLPVLMTMVLTLLSCANPSIKTISDKMDMSLIAGKWKGEFSSQTSGKSGTITFDLSLVSG